MKSIFPAFIALFLYSCSSKPPTTEAPPSLPVASILSGTATTWQEYPASIEGVADVEIRPQVSGTLDKVYVDEGAFVKAGQPIFKINDQPYLSQLNNALAVLHAAEGAMLNSQLEIEKISPLVQNHVFSDYQLKTARAAYEIAKADTEQAKATVSSARINLGYTLIRAPISGYIGRLLKKRGSLVAPSDAEALTMLSDIHQVYVYFSLSERDFASFKDQYPGKDLPDKIKQLPSVVLRLADDSEYERKGKIDMIDGHFDKNTGAITLRASFPNDRGFIRSGNTGKIFLALQHKDALLIPQSATMEVQDKIYVFAVDDSNKVRRQAITIIGKTGTSYLAKDGVKPGDRIVLSGFDNLQEGTIIRPEKVMENLSKN